MIVRRSRGFTLTELVIAMAVGSVFWILAYRAFSGLGRTQDTVDRRSDRAILEARLYDMLMADIRSADQIDPIPGRETNEGLRLRRGVIEDDGRIRHVDVEWARHGQDMIVRRSPDGEQIFDFRDTYDLEFDRINFVIEMDRPGLGFDPGGPGT